MDSPSGIADRPLTTRGLFPTSARKLSLSGAGKRPRPTFELQRPRVPNLEDRRDPLEDRPRDDIGSLLREGDALERRGRPGLGVVERDGHETMC